MSRAGLLGSIERAGLLGSIGPRRIKHGGTTQVPGRGVGRAIRMVVDPKRDPTTRSGGCGRIGTQFGTNADTLRGSATQAEVDAETGRGPRPVMPLCWPR